MFPLYRVFAIFFLALSAKFVSAQSSFFQPLNGPHGALDVEAIASDASGRLFMFMNGRVYRSADNGDSWSECTDGLPTWFHLYLKQFISTPSGDIYIDLDFGYGLYRYSPNDDSWVVVPAQISPWEPYYAIDMDLQGRFWMSTSSSSDKIYYSTDGCQTFQQVSFGNPLLGWIDHIAAHSDSHNLFQSSHLIFHFDINGAIQPVLNMGSSHPLFLDYNPNTGTAFCTNFDISKRSADGGFTWQDITLLPGGQQQPAVMNMTFEPNGRIWAHTRDGMFWSEDDGQTWTHHAPFDAFDGLFQLVGNTWFHADCELFRTTDQGATWEDLTNTLKSPAVYDIKKDELGNLYALTCQRESYEISSDEGQTWADLTIQDGVAVQVTSLAVGANGVMLAVGQNNKYYRSFDSGANWTGLTSISPHSNGVPTYFYADALGVFYRFQEYSSTVSKSTDNGNTWQHFQSSLYKEGKVAISPITGDILQSDIGYASLYLSSLDTAFYLEYNGEALPSINAMHCTSKGDFFLSRYSWSGQDIGLFRLSNGSLILEKVPFFNQKPVLEITSNAKGEIFVATEEGLYYSDDNGFDWKFLAPFPTDVSTYFSTMYIAPDQYLYAGFLGTVIHRSAQPTGENIFAVGTADLSSPYAVTAYPNPFDAAITFEIKGPVLPGNAVLRLFDALGRQVRRAEFAGEKFVVQRNELETGLYYFLIESDGKQLGAGKLMAR
jgi:photosystem II stability/assembly factor-like uncharacterized protein